MLSPIQPCSGPYPKYSANQMKFFHTSDNDKHIANTVCWVGSGTTVMVLFTLPSHISFFTQTFYHDFAEMKIPVSQIGQYS